MKPNVAVTTIVPRNGRPRGTGALGIVSKNSSDCQSECVSVSDPTRRKWAPPENRAERNRRYRLFGPIDRRMNNEIPTRVRPFRSRLASSLRSCAFLGVVASRRAAADIVWHVLQVQEKDLLCASAA